MTEFSDLSSANQYISDLELAAYKYHRRLVAKHVDVAQLMTVMEQDRKAIERLTSVFEDYQKLNKEVVGVLNVMMSSLLNIQSKVNGQLVIENKTRGSKP